LATSSDGRRPRKPGPKRTSEPRRADSRHLAARHLAAVRVPRHQLPGLTALTSERRKTARLRAEKLKSAPRKMTTRMLERRTKRRVRVLLLVSLLAFAGISFRLVQIQTVSAPRLRALAVAQRLRTIPLSGERGGIFARDGSDLAISVTRDTIYADPSYVSDPGMYAAKLAPVVGVDESQLYHDLLAGRQSGSRYVVVAKTVDDDVSARTKTLVDHDKLAGVGFLPESKRIYPSNLLAAPVIGTVGTDQTGLSGLESQYNSLLQGRSGTITVEVDQSGHEIPRTTRKNVPAERGSDLVLSIDENLQYQVETSLADQVAAQHATGGTAVVTDTRTGDVLAMASVDGLAYGSQLAGPLEHNRPMTDVLEPGSTNKAITVATALQDKLITPNTSFTVPDQIEMGGHSFKDDEFHPTEQMNAEQILTHSSNVGAIGIASLLGKVKLDQALRSFGLGSLTAAKFPGQSPGLLIPVSQYADTGMGSVPIGYGLAVTPLQMVDVYATLANGGVTVPPRLLDATISPNGKRKEAPVVAGHRVVSTTTASQVTQMLEGVVRQGTGVCAAVPGFDVAGKTGTSRIPLASGGYSSSQHMASFVGYAPAEAPRIASIVILNNPRDVYGGSAAAPVFSEIMAAALRAKHVVPTAPSTNPPQWIVANQAALQQRTPCSVPHGSTLSNMLGSERAAVAARAAQAARAAAAAAVHAAYERAHPKKKTTSHSTSTTSSSGASPTSTGPPRRTGTVPTTTTAPNG
jgi:cell division protein FtsI (penicillin-binding protein 3)